MTRHLVILAITSRLLGLLAANCCILSARSDVAAQDSVQASDYRYPIRVDGKSGYVDSAGRIAITPRFGDAKAFSDGLALVYLEKRRGEPQPRYIDRSGAIVFRAPAKNALTPFSEGLACGSDGRMSFHFDRQGVVLQYDNALQFRRVKPFSEGLAPVDAGSGKSDASTRWLPDEKWGFVDRSGKLAIPCRYFAAKRFSNGLAPVCVNEPYGLDKSKWGFINKKGQLVIAAKFDDAWPFSEGLALVQVFRDEELNERKGYVVYRYAYINAIGEQVIPFREYGNRRADCFQEGLAAVGGLNGEWNSPPAFIDKRGGVAITVEDDVASCHGFCGGHALARSENGKYGYLDREGKWSIPAQFERAEQFVGPLARVGIGQQFGYIDRSGKRIWWSPGEADFRNDGRDGD